MISKFLFLFEFWVTVLCSVTSVLQLHLAPPFFFFAVIPFTAVILWGLFSLVVCKTISNSWYIRWKYYWTVSLLSLCICKKKKKLMVLSHSQQHPKLFNCSQQLYLKFTNRFCVYLSKTCKCSEGHTVEFVGLTYSSLFLFLVCHLASSLPTCSLDGCNDSKAAGAVGRWPMWQGNGSRRRQWGGGQQWGWGRRINAGENEGMGVVMIRWQGWGSQC